MKHWIDGIDRNTELYAESFEPLDVEALNWKPSPKVWSVAENIQHVMTLNRSYFPGFEGLVAGRDDLPFHARFGFLARFFGRLIGGYSTPDRRKKTGTFDLWKPSSSHHSRTIVSDFRGHQEAFKREVERLEPFLGTGARISSPASRLVFFDLETALDILVAHEERHYRQAMEVLAGR